MLAHFILNKEKLHFLSNTLSKRLTVHPYGGHGGNLTYHENIEQLFQFFGATL
ncbi:MAG: hypothetical protein COB94_002100 [Gammaproteobacteria bacterium]|nr:hypothetical protein [Gammaproteobacteria bacterium]